MTDQRKNDGETRYVDLILKRILELDSNDLTTSRPPERRFTGTCRDFAIILCSILSHQKVPSRIRCGFANYFVEGKYEDHWVCEYWNSAESKWILVDAEIDESYKKYFNITFDPNNVPRNEFLVGAQAWEECTSGKLDPDLFGISSVGFYGIGEVRGNLIRDLAALNKIELLRWDDIELSDKEFNQLTKEERILIDKVADLTLPDNEDFEGFRNLYQNDLLKVPSIVKSHTAYYGLQMVKLRSQ